MNRPLTRILLLALVSIAGIVGMLVGHGAWDWLFLALAALPLLIGAVMSVWHARKAILQFCDEMSAMAAEW